eukprot:TRINITY_DN321_c0_g1_i1.p1 TRINITY_DN321_c0_g1~~TRINITY_DN321_c0_g1_i1.p1  ORF type:complete len:495 (+),score=75.90 TRINITY_DN321_c0_g1_i1:1076-2560(+)
MMQMGLFQELANIMEVLPYAKQMEQEHEVDDDDEYELQNEETEEEQEEIEHETNGQRKEVQDTGIDGNSRVKSNKGKCQIQTYVFSATLTLPENMKTRLRKGKGGGAGGKAPTLQALVEQLRFRGKPKIVDLTPSKKVAEKVQESRIQCLESDRDMFVYYILAKHTGRTLVFCTSISAVRRVVEILRQLGIGAHALHAKQQQRQRLKSLDRFKNDSESVLVATDVAARGLDIPDVQCVVHYQLPASADMYIHRSGRTARVQAEGISIALVTPQEAPRFRALIYALKRQQVPPDFPVDPQLVPKITERVQLAEKIVLLQRQLNKQKNSKSWLAKSAEDLDLDISEESESDDQEEQYLAENEHKVAQLRAKLMDMLSEPLVTGISKKFLAGGQVVEEGGKIKSGVEIAEKLAAHQKAAIKASKSKVANQTSEKQNQKLTLKQMRAKALEEAVNKRLNKKSGKSKVFTVSSKTMVGREQFGPNALEALRTKLELIQQ